MKIAREIEHPIYDCLHLATAERWEADFVTADKQLGRKAENGELSVRILLLG